MLISIILDDRVVHSGGLYTREELKRMNTSHSKECLTTANERRSRMTRQERQEYLYRRSWHNNRNGGYRRWQINIAW